MNGWKDRWIKTSASKQTGEQTVVEEWLCALVESEWWNGKKCQSTKWKYF